MYIYAPFQIERQHPEKKKEDAEPLCKLENYQFVIAVCDGMGGRGAQIVGDKTQAHLASRYLMNIVRNFDFYNRAKQDFELEIQNFFSGLNTQDPESRIKIREGYPTTICVAFSNLNNTVTCYWAGDSRLYLILEDDIIPFTKDHTNEVDCYYPVNSSPLTMYISSRRSIVEEKLIPYDIFNKCVGLFVCTDGLIDCFDSPMEMNYFMLDFFSGYSIDYNAFEEKFSKRKPSDDATISGLFFNPQWKDKIISIKNKYETIYYDFFNSIASYKSIEDEHNSFMNEFRNEEQKLKFLNDEKNNLPNEINKRYNELDEFGEQFKVLKEQVGNCEKNIHSIEGDFFKIMKQEYQVGDLDKLRNMKRILDDIARYFDRSNRANRMLDEASKNKNQKSINKEQAINAKENNFRYVNQLRNNIREFLNDSYFDTSIDNGDILNKIRNFRQMSEDFSNYTVEVENNKKQIIELEKHINDLIGDIERCNKEIGDFENRIKNGISEFSSQSKDFEIYNIRTIALEEISNITNIVGSCISIAEEIDSYRKRKEFAENELSELKKKRDGFFEKIKEMIDNSKKIEKDIDDCKEKIKKLDKKIKEGNEQYSEALKKLKELRTQYYSNYNRNI